MINEEMLKHPDCKLRMIANFGNGVDNIDVTAAHARGITVTNTPKVLTEDTADMTMALILAVPRRLIEGASILTEGKNWPGWSPTWMLGHRIGGKRLGIIGMGRIGQAVARRARAFGLQIHYHNRRPVAPVIAEELGATYWESLDQMLARMDIISVNCPHTPATFHLLSARRLKLIRKDAYIVNTARGEVIDEDTLIKLIESGDIAGAGLDVYEHEPAVNPKLVRLAKAGKVGAAAAYGFGHHRRPRRDGREGDHQYPNLPRQPQAAGPRAAQHAVRPASTVVALPRRHWRERGDPSHASRWGERTLQLSSSPRIARYANDPPSGRRRISAFSAAPASAIPRQRPRTPRAPAAAGGGSGNTETVPETARTNRRAR